MPNMVKVLVFLLLVLILSAGISFVVGKLFPADIVGGSFFVPIFVYLFISLFMCLFFLFWSK